MVAKTDNDRPTLIGSYKCAQQKHMVSQRDLDANINFYQNNSANTHKLHFSCITCLNDIDTSDKTYQMKRIFHDTSHSSYIETTYRVLYMVQMFG